MVFTLLITIIIIILLTSWIYINSSKTIQIHCGLQLHWRLQCYSITIEWSTASFSYCNSLSLNFTIGWNVRFSIEILQLAKNSMWLARFNLFKIIKWIRLFWTFCLHFVFVCLLDTENNCKVCGKIIRFRCSCWFFLLLFYMLQA